MKGPIEATIDSRAGARKHADDWPQRASIGIGPWHKRYLASRPGCAGSM